MSETTSLFCKKDQELLDLTQNVRKRIITELTESDLPDVKSDQNFLIKALDGLDRSVLSQTKLKSDERATQTQKETAKLVADMLMRHTVKINSPSQDRNLNPDIDVHDVVEGELEIGLNMLNPEDFS